MKTEDKLLITTEGLLEENEPLINKEGQFARKPKDLDELHSPEVIDALILSINRMLDALKKENDAAG